MPNTSYDLAGRRPAPAPLGVWFRPQVTQLEDRVTPANVTVTGTTAFVNLNVTSEVVSFTTPQPGVINITSTGGVTTGGSPVSPPLSLSGITAVVVTDSAVGTGVQFNNSTPAYTATFTVTLNNTPNHVTFFGTSAFGNHNLTVTTARDVQVFGSVTTTAGNITLTANQQATPTTGLFAGIDVEAGTISSTTGAVSLTGRGGTDTGGFESGVVIQGGDGAASVSGRTVVITGTGGATIGPSNIGVFISGTGTTVTAGSGGLTITGTGGGVSTGGGSNFGVAVSSSAKLTSAGGGAVVVTGNGGTGSGGNNVGVMAAGGSFGSGGNLTVAGTGGKGGSGNSGVAVVGTGSNIDSTGGAVNVAGVGGVGSDSFGVTVTDGGTVASGRTGSLTITTDSLNVAATAGIEPTIRAGTAGNGTVTIRPVTAGLPINIGAAEVLSGPTPSLGLTDAELDRVFAGTLVVGSPTAGSIRVTTFTRPTATAIRLVSGADIFTLTAGGLNTSGGTLTVTPGGVFAPLAPGVDATASGVAVTGSGVLQVRILGTVIDTQYTPLTVVGTLNLSGVTLQLTGGYVPVAGDTFLLASASVLAGTFAGLPNGAVVTFNGVNLHVFYTATTASLVVNRPPVGVTAGGPYSITAGQGVTLTASATDPDGDPLTFTWDVNGDGVYGDEAAGSVSNGGKTVTFTAAQLRALGVGAGQRTVSVRVSDGLGGTATASTTLTVVPAPATVVTSDAGVVRVFSPDGRTHDLVPFPGYLGDVTVASADMNGDGIPEVVIGAGSGAAPHVKVYDGASGRELASFYAYDPRFTGGVFVAASADGRIVTGAGAFGGPHVKVFDITGRELASFYAYDPRFTGGVRVAIGDVTGDGVDDIVTGAGPGAGPHVKVFDGRTLAEVRSFLAFESGFTGGVYVAATAGRIAVGAGTWGGPHVQVFDAAGNVQSSFFAYPTSFVGGVRVRFADTDGDGTPEVVTAPGLGGGLPVRSIRLPDLTELESFVPFDPLDPLGVFVG